MIQSIAVGILLGVWLLFTLASNIPQLGALIFRYVKLGNLASLIPSWTFFAPNPADRDYALFYRERFNSGDLSPWHEVLSSATPRSLTTAFWNPDSRLKKAISDAASVMLRFARSAGDAKMSLFLSVPYLLVLNRISEIPKGPGVTGRQFLLARHSRLQENPAIIVLSNLHDV